MELTQRYLKNEQAKFYTYFGIILQNARAFSQLKYVETPVNNLESLYHSRE